MKTSSSRMISMRRWWWNWRHWYSC